jgi:hypothetical protein
MAYGQAIFVKLAECRFEPCEVGVVTDTCLSTDRLSPFNGISVVPDVIRSHEVVTSCNIRTDGQGTASLLRLPRRQVTYKRGFATLRHCVVILIELLLLQQ